MEDAILRGHKLSLLQHGHYIEAEAHKKCALCGGEMTLLIEVAHNAQRYDQDHPRTKYFRCDNCRQIQIVEE